MNKHRHSIRLKIMIIHSRMRILLQYAQKIIRVYLVIFVNILKIIINHNSIRDSWIKLLY